MTGIRQPIKGILKAAVVASALSGVLTGCAGFDGIEFQGAIFDAIGVSGTAAPASEPQVADRAPLVVPPDTKRLPAPGAAPQTVSAQQSWPQDPEQTKAARDAARERNVAKYCGDKDWWLSSKPDEFNRVTNNGSLCKTAIGQLLNKQFNGK